MHIFCVVFGLGMMGFFAIVAVASVFMFAGAVISGTQFLLLVPACLAGAGLAAELYQYGEGGI